MKIIPCAFLQVSLVLKVICASLRFPQPAAWVNGGGGAFDHATIFIPVKVGNVYTFVSLIDQLSDSYLW